MTNKTEKTHKEKGVAKFTTFLSDGVSERDFLLVLSAVVFFLFVSVALILVLFQIKIDSMYISLLDMVSEVMMVIVLSVFSLGGVEKVTDYLGSRETMKDKADAMERIDILSEHPVENNVANTNSNYENNYEDYKSNYENGDDII